ncbi:MAG: hypothetical protein ACTXOO_04475 [Sodalis sp. (in: enterobacteria)]
MNYHFLEEALEALLSRKPSKRVYDRIVGSNIEVHVIALSLSKLL